MDTTQDTALIVSGGGFGDIWKGKLHSGGKVAIKTWRTNTLEQCDYKTVKRAARELFLWSQMKHLNVHQLQGVIMFRDHCLGMVSEWMENGNLHEYLRKQPSADRYQLCVHVASGLEYMHKCSTIHGDLKAINVLVSSDGVAKLSDFDFSIMSGMSSLVFSESSNSRSGSARWSAPEILLVETPVRTTQADVYALGMTMLEIFTGQVPYPECQKEFTISKKVENGTLPDRPWSQLKDEEQGNVMWQLLLDCWNREPGERPSSGQVADAVASVSYMQGLTEEDGSFGACGYALRLDGTFVLDSIILHTSLHMISFTGSFKFIVFKFMLHLQDMLDAKRRRTDYSDNIFRRDS
ncbi:hypothetical protein RSOLAG22IIIB_09063 [Rhizoctonia solani]|uniref:Protein kinase domain-containing protein n=1 Tax=Rhizoctonia solani TaxID=456999 RepID=A0A0K6FWV2_9AGAM|nr:hypothetical protein RSOLAG22IIIB_09063 [Rhizoctonia solani]